METKARLIHVETNSCGILLLLMTCGLTVMEVNSFVFALVTKVTFILVLYKSNLPWNCLTKSNGLLRNV